MAQSNKSSASRRKSSKGVLVLKISPKALQKLQLAFKIKEESVKDVSSPALQELSMTGNSSVTDSSIPASKSNSPSQPSTPVSSIMPPPVESTKHKGTKRSSAAALASEELSNQKFKGKPGPKKKSKLDDAVVNHPNTTPKPLNPSAIKLGPKANQGAINAGLRALDRSGKPCRRWAKESFKLKSFTGVCWEIPRWRAPPKILIIDSLGDSCSDSTQNEMKDTSQLESEQSEKSNTVIDIDIDIEMGSLKSTNTFTCCSPDIFG